VPRASSGCAANYLACDFNSLLPPFSFQNEKKRHIGNVVCRSQVSKPSNLMQKQMFLDVILKIFLAVGAPRKNF